MATAACPEKLGGSRGINCGNSGSLAAVGAEQLCEELLAPQGPHWPPFICTWGGASSGQLKAKQLCLNPRSASLPGPQPMPFHLP